MMNNQGTQLTITAFWARMVIKWGGISLLAIFFLHTGWIVFQRNWKRVHPAPPPPPDVAFGTLPHTKFSEPKLHPHRFQLQTIDGHLPSMPTQMKVYFVVTQQSRLLAFDQANATARQLGFTSPAQKSTNNLLTYHKSKTGETFTINPLTQNFNFSYPFEHDQTIMSQPLPTNLDLLRQTALRFLQNIASSHLDFINPSNITFYKLTGNGVQPANSLSDSNLAQVSFERKNIGNYPLLPPSPQNPNVSVWVTGGGSHNVVRARFIHFPIDREKFATYPLISAQQAWQKLKNNHYHLARLSPQFNDKQPIIIRKIFLAYLDPNYATEFLKPIYVFKGSSDFLGYVEAVSPEFLNN